MPFGSKVCEVSNPREVLQRITEGMRQAMREVQRDPRIPQSLRTDMAAAWGIAGWTTTRFIRPRRRGPLPKVRIHA